jgi:hypothetical protein
MTGAMSPGIRLLSMVAAGAVALALAGPVVKGTVQDDGRLRTADGDTVEMTSDARARGLSFAPDLAPRIATGSSPRWHARGPRRRA